MFQLAWGAVATLGFDDGCDLVMPLSEKPYSREQRCAGVVALLRVHVACMQGCGVGYAPVSIQQDGMYLASTLLRVTLFLIVFLALTMGLPLNLVWWAYEVLAFRRLPVGCCSTRRLSFNP